MESNNEGKYVVFLNSAKNQADSKEAIGVIGIVISDASNMYVVKHLTSCKSYQIGYEGNWYKSRFHVFDQPPSELERLVYGIE